MQIIETKYEEDVVISSEHRASDEHEMLMIRTSMNFFLSLGGIEHDSGWLGGKRVFTSISPCGTLKTVREFSL